MYTEIVQCLCNDTVSVVGNHDYIRKYFPAVDAVTAVGKLGSLHIMK